MDAIQKWLNRNMGCGRNLLMANLHYFLNLIFFYIQKNQNPRFIWMLIYINIHAMPLPLQIHVDINAKTYLIKFMINLSTSLQKKDTVIDTIMPILTTTQPKSMSFSIPHFSSYLNPWKIKNPPNYFPLQKQQIFNASPHFYFSPVIQVALGFFKKPNKFQLRRYIHTK